MDADNADDIALLANTPIQVESSLHSLERAAGGMGPIVNADKTEYICFNQRGDISTLNRGPLKLVDKFTIFGSRPDQTNKKKRSFFKHLSRKPSKLGEPDIWHTAGEVRTN